MIYFDAILEKLVPILNKGKARYALIGGLAVAKHGFPRGTEDIDFLVDQADLEKFAAGLKEYGFVLTGQGPGLTFFGLGGMNVKPRLDVLHAAKSVSRGMLERVSFATLSNNQDRIPLISIEDLIGLKLYAIRQKEARRGKDWQDIEMLIRLHSDSLDWAQLEAYFKMFTMDLEWKQAQSLAKK